MTGRPTRPQPLQRVSAELLRCMRSIAAGMLLAGAPALAQPEATHQSILQTPNLPRLEAALLAVTPPEQRVRGLPGTLQIIERSCRSQPAAGLRERIVHTAVQEWAWFGFLVDDLRNEPAESAEPGNGNARPRWRLGLHPDEVRQVANTVGGY